MFSLCSGPTVEDGNRWVSQWKAGHADDCVGTNDLYSTSCGGASTSPPARNWTKWGSIGLINHEKSVDCCGWVCYWHVYTWSVAVLCRVSCRPYLSLDPVQTLCVVSWRAVAVLPTWNYFPTTPACVSSLEGNCEYSDRSIVRAAIPTWKKKGELLLST